MPLPVLQVANPKYFCAMLEAFAKENPGHSFFIRIQPDDIKSLRALIDDYKVMQSEMKEMIHA